MTYETIDWEAEAKRVARAFGIKRECRFKTVVPNQSKVFVVKKWLFRDNRMFDSGLELQVQYATEWRSFILGNPESKSPVNIGYDYAGVQLEWDGAVYPRQGDAVLSKQLAKGLFHLDLLTPELEVALELDITAHERMEWVFEHDERMKAL